MVVHAKKTIGTVGRVVFRESATRLLKLRAGRPTILFHRFNLLQKCRETKLMPKSPIILWHHCNTTLSSIPASPPTETLKESVIVIAGTILLRMVFGVRGYGAAVQQWCDWY